jgi:glucosyl-3-phosphoglycerate synthase
MADFFQQGSITTLHKLRERPIEEIEGELLGYAAKRPMALILPSLYSELEGPALPRIVAELKRASYISDIIVGLDQADRERYRRARAFFAELPQRHHILWNDGPRLRVIDAQLRGEELAPSQAGKGRNVWYCMGYALALEHCQAIALHDCDITTYNRSLPARLFYPVANPNFSFDFCKGYYARIDGDRLGGRATRLFYTPLIRALKKTVGSIDYLEFMDSFRYPLSGEFSLSRDFVKMLRIPSDWGLEVGVLSEVYRNLTRNRVCQVDIADHYDHKHQDLSREDAGKGLSRMSVEIAKSLFRKLATEGIALAKEDFRAIKASYYRAALDATEHYYYDARINGLDYDRHKEERCVEHFAQSVMSAGESFQANPMESPFIPNWNRVHSAFPDIYVRLLQAVREDAAD